MELNSLKQDIQNHPDKYTVWLPQLIDLLLRNIDIR
jgi:hypothetical protein